jgi:hypothetical protein
MGVKVIPIGTAADAESCCVCGQDTNTWYIIKDVALCPVCAAQVEYNEVPSKRDWLVSLGVNLPKDWKCNADQK